MHDRDAIFRRNHNELWTDMFVLLFSEIGKVLIEGGVDYSWAHNENKSNVLHVETDSQTARQPDSQTDSQTDSLRAGASIPPTTNTNRTCVLLAVKAATTASHNQAKKVRSVL